MRKSKEIAVAALSASVLLLYGRILQLWWTFDDVFHLHVVSGHSAWEFFFSPKLWHQLPFRLFTPLLLLSYAEDRVLSGVEPAAFHVHHLVVCATAAAVLFFLLRQWLDTVLAGIGAFLFVAGVPFVTWAQRLMYRHYVEGFVLAALAALLFVGSVRGAGTWTSGISALFYFLAMLAKEVYVPLFGLLLLLPETSLGGRLRKLKLHAIALAVYLVWRRAMIGTVLGGYGWATQPRELPSLILGLLGKLLGTLLSDSTFWSVVLLGTLLVGIGFELRRSPGSAILILGGAILIVGPVIPVAKAVDPRFGALLWLLLVVPFLFGCARLSSGGTRHRTAAAVLLVVAMVSTVASNRARWNVQFRQAKRMSEEGRFFLSLSPGDLLRHPQIFPAAMEETRWLKEEYLHLPKGAGWFDDDIYMCSSRQSAGRIYEYDTSAERVREVTAAALLAADSLCFTPRSRALEATFELSGDSLFWTLGPYETGTYHLLRERGVQSFAVARQDGYQLKPDVLSLIVRYDSPAGWVTYSPPLRMDFRVASRFRWARTE